MKTVTQITATAIESTAAPRRFNGPSNYRLPDNQAFTPDGVLVINKANGAMVLFPYAQIEAAAVAIDPNIKSP